MVDRVFPVEDEADGRENCKQKERRGMRYHTIFRAKLRSRANFNEIQCQRIEIIPIAPGSLLDYDIEESCRLLYIDIALDVVAVNANEKKESQTYRTSNEHHEMDTETIKIAHKAEMPGFRRLFVKDKGRRTIDMAAGEVEGMRGFGGGISFLCAETDHHRWIVRCRVAMQMSGDHFLPSISWRISSCCVRVCSFSCARFASNTARLLSISS